MPQLFSSPARADWPDAWRRSLAQSHRGPSDSPRPAADARNSASSQASRPPPRHRSQPLTYPTLQTPSQTPAADPLKQTSTNARRNSQPNTASTADQAHPRHHAQLQRRLRRHQAAASDRQSRSSSSQAKTASTTPPSSSPQSSPESAMNGNSYPSSVRESRVTRRYYWHTLLDTADENFMVSGAFPLSSIRTIASTPSATEAFRKRAFYAATRVLVTRQDDGNKTSTSPRSSVQARRRCLHALLSRPSTAPGPRSARSGSPATSSTAPTSPSKSSGPTSTRKSSTPTRTLVHFSNTYLRGSH